MAQAILYVLWEIIVKIFVHLSNLFISLQSRW